MQNPPFGTKVRHADRAFLKKACEAAPVIYSFHKSETASFVGKFAADENFKITDELRFQFPLKKSYAFHQKKRAFIEVSCYRLERK